jgi:transposase
LGALGEETLHGVIDPQERLDMTKHIKQSTEAAVREIRRRTRRKFSPEEKIRIVLEGLRGEQSVSELCRREGIAANLYYRWSKDFFEAGKKQLAAAATREATSDEVKKPTRREQRVVCPRSPICPNAADGKHCSSSKYYGPERLSAKRRFLISSYAARSAR